jgi:hypothetical protein
MHKGMACVVVAIGCGGGSHGQPADGGPGDGRTSRDAPSDGRSTGGSHDLGSCPVFAVATGNRDYTYWNLDITTASVDPLSDAYIASMNGATTHFHPDFGSNPGYGIPFVTVPGSQPKVPMHFANPSESDPGPYPYPPDAPIEAGSDGHVLVVDRDHCILYETGNSVHVTSPDSWTAYSGARFDLASGTMLRPEGWTSADASGGPILVGLARYEEVAAGVIPHALRFTASATQRAYVHPATHFASSDTTSTLPPMGLRLRLKASACPTLLAGAGTVHPQSKVIVQAMCTYGTILTDNGSNFYVTGATDPRWDDNDLDYLKTIPGDDFEAIATGPLTT